MKGRSSGVKWYHRSGQLTDRGRHRLIDKGNEHWLEIFDTYPSDGGQIQCVASNDISSIESVFSLTVTGKA